MDQGRGEQGSGAQGSGDQGRVGAAGLLHDLAATAASATPDRAAVVDAAGAVLTFAELDACVRSVAAWAAARTSPGDRVAVIADNGLPYAVLVTAVPRAGRVLTMVNQRLSPPEQLVQLRVAEPTVVVGEGRFIDALGGPDGLRRAVPSVAEVAMTGSAAWTEALEDRGAPPPAPAPDSPAWLLFTSGSTGVPKGVVHTHRSALAGVLGTVEARSVRPGTVYLLPFPMCHIAGYNLLVHHAVGATVVVVPHFRPDEFAAAVRAHGVTSCSLAPTMLHALLDHLAATAGSLPTLRSVAYGSAAISADLIRRAGEVLAVDFHQGFGMTETAGNVTFLGPDEHRAGLAGDAEALRSAGRPHPGVEVRVVDDAGADVDPGETGEIVVRGPQVTPGYWRDPAATAAAFHPDPEHPSASGLDWFRTGDVGRVDGAGRLAVVDRRKDVIITGGENVSSREVEDALSTHPGVAMVAVVGVPDPYWGEAICAVVVPRGEPPAAEELVAHVRARISPFKRPRHVVVVDELPLTSNGKVAKDAVRRIARAAVAPVPDV